MPRAIAPDVTTTTSTPSRCSAGDLLADARDDGQAQLARTSRATIDDPSLTTATGMP